MNDNINIITIELENKVQNKSVAVRNQIVYDAKSFNIRLFKANALKNMRRK